jgi:cytochrome c oxidase subunit 2
MSMPSRSRTGAGPLIAGTLIVLAIGVAIVVLAVAGLTPGRVFDSFFPVGGQAPVTDRGHATRQLYDIVFYIAAAIFLLVEGLIIFTAFRYRRKPGDDDLPPQIHGNNLVEVLWTAIPLGIVLFLFVISWQTLNTVDAKAAGGDVHVRAVAARFQWKFDYLDGPDGPNAKVIYEQLLPVGEGGGLVLPVGDPVHVTLSSPDVIHAFYVPKFLFKRDVVPGKLNNFDFTVDTAGTYRGQCAELCGEFHGSMLFEVNALPKPDFDAWLAAAVKKAQQSPPPPPSGGPPASGAPAAQAVQIEAKNTAFTQNAVTAPANAPFTIHFKNDDAIPHNVQVKDSTGKVAFNGDLLTGPAETDYQVPALAPGTYPFDCIVHANMTGTITVQ